MSGAVDGAIVTVLVGVAFFSAGLVFLLGLLLFGWSMSRRLVMLIILGLCGSMVLLGLFVLDLVSLFFKGKCDLVVRYFGFWIWWLVQ